ncbi:MAG: chromosomal replication initiator protein DnaA, partial [Elusimicrobia bacterium RIFOXYB2_FULL_48_7]
PKAKVLYVTAEKFINEFIESLTYQKPASFRNKFRNLDCLLIDDIQFLTEKQRSQEEFFNTFNALYDFRKQILITSDRPPKELQNLEERLISRFEWGVIADVKPPDLETRIAILRKKAEGEKIYVPDDVILFLASQIKSNIRKLEGSLIRIVAFSSLTGTPLTVDTAKEILSDIIRREEIQKPITIEKIQKVVARHYHQDIKDMRSKKRTDEVAFPRQTAMYLARSLTERSTIEIGEAFGGKDHTTVLHAWNKIKTMINTDPFFAANINKLVEDIKKEED